MPTRKLPLFLLMLCSLICCHTALPQGPPLNRVVVFGDSLCDSGNLFAITQGEFPFEGPAPIFPINFYPEGRFSNGPIWTETFAPTVGFATPEPIFFPLPMNSFGINPFGTNFAFGGAETGLGDSLRMTPNLRPQIELFAGVQGGFNGNELIVLWAGSNDFNPVPPATLPAPQEVVANMVSRITELNQLGGKYFLIPNLSPLGDTPEGLAQGPLVSFFLNLTVIQYNLLLNEALNDLEEDLGICVFRLDTFGLVAKATRYPEQFGLTNVTEPAFELPGSVVANPDRYLYWDSVHPTTYSHGIIGKVAVNAYLIGSMKLAFESNESWGINVSGWFGQLHELGLVSRLNTAKFFLDNGSISAAAFWLKNYRSKVNSLAAQGRLSASDAGWLNDQATTSLNCLDRIQD